MTSSTETGRKSLKRKGPPEFRHLPITRAQKLKRDWVEKKKLRSQWRVQKRKEGWTIREPAGGHADKTRGDSTHLGEETEVMGVGLGDDLNSNSEEGSVVTASLMAGSSHATNTRALSGGVRNDSGVQSNLSTLSTNPAPSRSTRELYRPAQTKNIDSWGHQRYHGHGRGRERVYDGKTGRSLDRKSRQPDMRQKMGDLLEKIQKTYSI